MKPQRRVLKHHLLHQVCNLPVLATNCTVAGLVWALKPGAAAIERWLWNFGFGLADGFFLASAAGSSAFFVALLFALSATGVATGTGCGFCGFMMIIPPSSSAST